MKKAILITLVTFIFLLNILQSCKTSEVEIKDIKLQFDFPRLRIPRQLHESRSLFTKDSGWPQIYDKGPEDSSNGIVIDSEGNIIVSGYTYYLDNSMEKIDILTIKYDSEGNELWNVTYDSGTLDMGWDIALDSFDNIIIYGLNATSLEDFQNLSLYLRVVKYNKDGVEQWNTSFKNEIQNYPGGIAVNSKNDIIINGGHGNIDDLDFHCWTIKMNSEGEELWNKTFILDIVGYGTDITVDKNDSIIVGGFSASYINQGFRIIEYDDDGNQIQSYIFKGNQPNAIALDSNENIILTGVGYSRKTNSSTWLTIKCDRQGNLLWTKEYDGIYIEVAEGLAVDSNDNIITVGASCFYSEDNYEHFTIIYDKDGNEICMIRPNVSGIINGVATSINDSIFVTGAIDRGNNWDYYTNLYVDVTPPVVQLVKPLEKNLYIFNLRLLKLQRNTIIIGKIKMLIEAENPSDVSKVEFYVDKILKETVYEQPYKFLWTDRLFFKHNIKIITYDAFGCAKKFEFDVLKFF